jgi:hypothetical protein
MLCCESTIDERSAGNRHATFCGSRGRFVAPGDPVGDGLTVVPYRDKSRGQFGVRRNRERELSRMTGRLSQSSVPRSAGLVLSRADVPRCTRLRRKLHFEPDALTGRIGTGVARRETTNDAASMTLGGSCGSGWGGPDSGCTFAGNSACGGTDAGPCTSAERYCTEKCPNGTVHKCFTDNYCASVSKGRAIVNESWDRLSAIDVIQQHGDRLYITGGESGPAQGEFVGPYTITAKWANTPAYTGTVTAPDGRTAKRITWDRPPGGGNYWYR